MQRSRLKSDRPARCVAPGPGGIAEIFPGESECGVLNLVKENVPQRVLDIDAPDVVVNSQGAAGAATRPGLKLFRERIMERIHQVAELGNLTDGTE